jgi:hypothetical protein
MCPHVLTRMKVFTFVVSLLPTLILFLPPYADGASNGPSGLRATRDRTTKVSEYTSLENKDCKILWRNTDLDVAIDSFGSVCPGRNGVRVILEGADARSWIGLLPLGAKYDDGVRFYSPTMFRSFANVEGKRLEWRYHGPKLVALIVRMGQSDAEGKETFGLIVFRVNIIRLDQTCQMGQTTSNEEARALADDLARTCSDRAAKCGALATSACRRS